MINFDGWFVTESVAVCKRVKLVAEGDGVPLDSRYKTTTGSKCRKVIKVK